MNLLESLERLVLCFKTLPRSPFATSGPADPLSCCSSRFYVFERSEPPIFVKSPVGLIIRKALLIAIRPEKREEEIPRLFTISCYCDAPTMLASSLHAEQGAQMHNIHAPRIWSLLNLGLKLSLLIATCLSPTMP